MAVSDILATIDSEIAKLRQVRALLSGGAAPTPKKAAGRPKKVVVATKKAAKVAPAATKPAKKKRNLSPEGRKRIAEAVKKRWAAQGAAGHPQSSRHPMLAYELT
jgi:mono/diheme cytochrome c family protein